MDQRDTQEFYANNSWARWTALLVMATGCFLTTITLSSVNVAIPAIAADLKTTGIYLSWLPTAVLLSNAISLLPVGKIADGWGRKRMFLLGTCALSTSSVLASLSPNIEFLLFCRVLNGIASAMVLSCSMAIVSSIFKGSQRGIALGITSSSLYLGIASGPLIGGWLTELYGWRSVFLFPVPLAVVSVALTLFRLKGEWLNPEVEPVDWIGVLLFGIAVVSVFVGISLLPSIVGFAVLIFAITVFWLFFVFEEKTEFPLVRFSRLSQNLVFSSAMLASMFVYAASYPLYFLLSLYLQYIQKLSASDAGKIMVVQAVLMVFVAPIAGRLSDRVQPTLVAAIGCVFIGIGFIVFQFLGETTPIILIITAMALMGLGFGLFATPNTNSALSVVREQRLGMASSLLSLSVMMGNMLGTAIAVTLMTLYIGANQMEPSQFPALLEVINLSMIFSLLFAVLGGYYSLRGLKISKLRASESNEQ